MNTTERVIREQFPFWSQAPAPAPMPAEGDYVVVGCGTSFYLAEIVARAFNLMGRPAIAVPGGEWARRRRAYKVDDRRHGDRAVAQRRVERDRAGRRGQPRRRAARPSRSPASRTAASSAAAEHHRGRDASRRGHRHDVVGEPDAARRAAPRRASRSRPTRPPRRRGAARPARRRTRPGSRGAVPFRLPRRRPDARPRPGRGAEAPGDEPQLLAGVPHDGIPPRADQPRRPDHLGGAALQPGDARRGSRGRRRRCAPKAPS